MHPDAWFASPSSVEALLRRQKFRGVVWESACGDGAISKVFIKHGYPVVSSDIDYYGYPGTIELNFLTGRPRWWFDNVVTNPPFRGWAIGPWIERACAYNRECVALMYPVHVLANLSRWNVGKMRLRRVITLTSFQWRHADRRLLNHRYGICWFVWEYGFRGSPVVEFASPWET